MMHVIRLDTRSFEDKGVALMFTLVSGKTARWVAQVALAASLLATLAGGSIHSAQARPTGDTSISGSVTFWNAYNTVGPENSTLIDKVLPAFQKAFPNVTVYSQNFPYGSLLQKIIASMASGDGPDVVRSDIIWVPQLAKIGALASTDDIMATRKAQFYPGPVATNYYKGHYYGLPLDTNTRVLIYNKAVFAKAGITTPPATTDEFQADAVKIAATGKNVFGYAEGGLDGWNILPWIWSFGGAITDPNGTKATGYINGPNSVAALTFLTSLLDQHLMSPSLLGSGLQTSDAIGKNLTGMILDGPWTPPIFLTTYPKLQLAFAPVPAGPNGHSASVVGGEDIVQLKNSKNAAAAHAFLQFMTSPQAQILMGEVGQMPVLKSVASSPLLPKYYAVFNKELQTAQPRTVSPNWAQIDTALTTAFNQALRHQATPQAALDTAAKTIDPLLK
jgi:multiple sugar transport system substrate-binding protein